MGSAHIIRTRSGIVPPKTAIYCGPHCGKFPSINATYARHKPTIMSGSVPQKSDVALQAHLNTLMFPRKFLIGLELLIKDIFFVTSEYIEVKKRTVH